jgi:hypothetical protein
MLKLIFATHVKRLSEDSLLFNILDHEFSSWASFFHLFKSKN